MEYLLTDTTTFGSIGASFVGDTASQVVRIPVATRPAHVSSAPSRIQVASADLVSFTSMKGWVVELGIVEVFVDVDFAAVGPALTKHPAGNV